MLHSVEYGSEKIRLGTASASGGIPLSRCTQPAGLPNPFYSRNTVVKKSGHGIGYGNNAVVEEHGGKSVEAISSDDQKINHTVPSAFTSI